MTNSRRLKLMLCGMVFLGVLVSFSDTVFARGLFDGFQKKNELTVKGDTDRNDSKLANNSVERTRFLEYMGQVYDFVKQAYYKEVDDDDLLEGALIGLFGHLGDPYSEYITRTQAKEFAENIQGEFGGLGIFINEGFDNESGIKFIKVVSPIEGTPAYYVGLQAGDLIVGVDDKSTADMSTDDAVKIMRGKPGTKVTLTIKRDSRVFKITITRAIINTVDLRYDKIDSQIAYIKILKFTNNTPIDFAKAVSSFKEDYEVLVVDLRNNPGGSLEGVVKTVNYLLPEDALIVGTESRVESEQVEYKATSELLVPQDKKVYVMINESSASASEIFSGAIKDNDRGVLLGRKSFGKGLVQSVRPYKGGYVKITIAQYYTPSGSFIDSIGIDPDHILDPREKALTAEELIHAGDMQSQDMVRLYVKEKNGIIDDSSINEFQDRLKEKKIPIDNKEFIRRVLLIGKNQYLNKIPAFSLEIDAELRETIDLIHSGKI